VTRGFAIATLLLVTACFAPSFETTECGNNAVCPSGLTCTATGLCAACGDGEATNGEECDDGNQSDEDDCRNDCRLNICGDLHVDRQGPAIEGCDEGAVDTATCNADCTVAACGDTYTNATAGELCDDGGQASDDGCRADCKSDESCGNGIVDDHLMLNARDNPAECAGDATTLRPGCREACDTMNFDGTRNPLCSPNCLSERVCGDGIRDTSIGEVCDDGNTMSGDVCSTDCLLLGAGCGNGVTDGDVGEECDTGLGVGGNDPIDSATCIDCKVSYCGDGRTNPVAGEVCDPGTPGVDVSDCDVDCTLPQCGDGRVNHAYAPPGGSTTEACDDGNSTAGDGCSVRCQIESSAKAAPG